MLTDIFPFYAEVWGTVSDWVMIAVTAGTAVFLFLTLRSQIKVQKAQQKIMRIEYNKFLDYIKPELTIKINIFNRFTRKDGTEGFFLGVELWCEKSTAINVRPRWQGSGISLGKYDQVNPIKRLYEGSLMPVFFVDASYKRSPAAKNNYISCQAHFQDIEGSDYFQTIFIRFKDGEENPEVVAKKPIRQT